MLQYLLFTCVSLHFRCCLPLLQLSLLSFWCFHAPQTPFAPSVGRLVSWNWKTDLRSTHRQHIVSSIHQSPKKSAFVEFNGPWHRNWMSCINVSKRLNILLTCEGGYDLLEHLTAVEVWGKNYWESYWRWTRAEIMQAARALTKRKHKPGVYFYTLFSPCINVHC